MIVFGDSLSLYSALGQAAPNLASIAKGRAAATNILNVIKDENYQSNNSSDKGKTLPKVDGKIEFLEVYFSYPSRPKMILENLSFTVSAGKTFAVVGPSGSGKSTVISLLQRFYEPNSGTSINICIYIYLVQLSFSHELTVFFFYQEKYCWMTMI